MKSRAGIRARYNQDFFHWFIEQQVCYNLPVYQSGSLYFRGNVLPKAAFNSHAMYLRALLATVMARTTVVQNHNARKKCPERHFVGRLSHFLALAQIFPSGFSSFDPLEAPSTGRRDTIGMSQNAHWHVHNRLEKLLR